MEEALTHYGTPRRSGRYPWGSGEDPYQRPGDILARADELRRSGMTETEVARALGMSSNQLRARKSVARNEQRKADEAQAWRLKERGYSNVAIGKRMGIGESSVRNLLKPSENQKADAITTTANLLRENVKDRTYVDVGVGVERYLGNLSKEKLAAAVSVLEDEGYQIQYLKVEQVGNPGKFTRLKVLTPPGTTYSEFYANRDKVEQLNMVIGTTEDGGKSYRPIQPIKNVDSKRIQIRYAEEGGADRDGVIELRRGVDDISLGKSRYAQVRIGVDGSHYLKGMAVYADDLPDGVDIRFNTNKPLGTPKEKTFKPLSDDEGNPFKTIVRQRFYTDANGKEHLSALNIVGSKGEGNVEGAWGEWSKTLSSQVLSKQRPGLAKQQLDLAFNIKKEMYDEIQGLTNPVVKKKLLESFADECDSDAVNLKAAALPRQRSHVILPVPDLKPNEIYAPNYKNGERVVLIRHPHAGPFEIPELVVNNRNKAAKRTLGANPLDAVGIHPTAAAKLSGADFDGDTVIVIPNNKRTIATAPSLKGLKNFNPQEAYPGYEGMKRMTAQGKGKAMGDVSNLITDMSVKGASDSEIARAVRHSMVVIDAEKHGLNYKQSAADNGIAALKKKYQPTGGASTLISRAKSDARPLDRELRKAKDGGPVDPKTGKLVYVNTNASYVDARGKTVYKTVKSTKMAETDDAFTLSSGERIENIYAEHANQLKRLANTTRKAALNTPPLKYSPSANKAYPKEVSSLKAKLNIALKNAPLERQAQILANNLVRAKLKDEPDMESSEKKKVKQLALEEARRRTGASKQQIVITKPEWEAIQTGAISNNMLNRILDNADQDRFKQLAMPRTTTGMSPAIEARARSLLVNGYGQAEIAEMLGVSASSINNVANGKD